MEPVTVTASPMNRVSKVLIAVLSLMLLLVTVFVIMRIHTYQTNLSEKEATILGLNNTVNGLESTLETVKKEVETLQIANCKGVWTKEGGCENNLSISMINLVNNKSCFGDVIKITWDPKSAPVDTMDILLTTPQTTLRLDTAASVKGQYEWTINKKHITTTGALGDATIAPGDLYKIRLQSGGQPVENGESNLFSISDCQ